MLADLDYFNRLNNLADVSILKEIVIFCFFICTYSISLNLFNDSPSKRAVTLAACGLAMFNALDKDYSEANVNLFLVIILLTVLYRYHKSKDYVKELLKFLYFRYSKSNWFLYFSLKIPFQHELNWCIFVV